MKRRQLLTTALSSLATLPALADGEARDGRGGRFEDDLFANLEGEWLLTRQIGGREAQNSVTATWVLQHQFLRLQMRDLATPSRYEADVYIGYSHATGEYVAHWMDNFGGHFAGEGRGRRSGNAVEFRFAYASGPFFNTFRWDPAGKTWSCLLESVAKNGERQLFARDTLVRRG